jgi:NAD(P)-dependent dehydrogenase (short-subunit alcohol dehydrogenase family)
VTGVSPNSLGEGLALSLASQSPGLLVLASRTPSKLDAIVHTICSKYPHVNVKTVLLDLASQKSVRAAAAEITDLIGREGNGIDVLFNNAGINVSERKLTPEGIELQFGTNHVGPFLLTNLLMPLLLRSKGARIVMTSSEALRISPVRFSDYNLEPGRKVEREDEPRRGLPEGILKGDGGYEPSVAYGQSKTANVLFAVGLNQRLGKGRGVESFAVMPGSEWISLKVVDSWWYGIC